MSGRLESPKRGMPMNAMTISLCTYTFNDARLAEELLEHVESWSVRPDERVVVDDGSERPFTTSRRNARIVRLDTNQGVGKAKSAGLSSCSGEFIVSLDCDIRLDPDWLRRALPLARDLEVGIVGAPIISDGGATLTARYERAFMGFHHDAAETNFLTGGLWLMRRDVWSRAGGFAGYAGRTHEDHHFCARVKALGLALRVCLPFARQVRRLHYADVVRRLWKWFEPALATKIASARQAEAAVLMAVVPMLERLNWAVEHGETLFGYIEFLGLLNVVLRCARLPQCGDGAATAVVVATRQVLSRALAACPRLHALVWADLRRLHGSDILNESCVNEVDSRADANVWVGLVDDAVALFPHALLRHLEARVPEILEDDADAADFSFYRHF